MKYVILTVERKDLGFTRACPFVFPEHIVHSKAKENFTMLILRAEGICPDFLSAGLCHVGKDGHGFVCTSGSESIGHIGTQERSMADERILNMPEAMQGIIL